MEISSNPVNRSLSLEGKAVQSPGFTSGFDYLRIILSCWVVLIHSFTTSYGSHDPEIMWTGYYGSLTYFLLPMFFALSGYLVAGSMSRTQSLMPFAVLRIIRLVPALAVEIALSAIILGALVTTLPLGDYYTHKDFFKYFMNVIGHIHFRLPGVFEGNPYENVVNISLWTIPYELECYIVLAVCFLVGAYKRPKVFLALTVALNIAALVVDYSGDRSVPPPGRLLVISFLWAVALYLHREKVRHSFGMFVASVAISLACFSFGATVYLAAPFIAYVTVYIGLLNPPKPFGADYSYGIYLYSFPIQQTYSYLLPGYHVWWINFLICLPLSFVFATISWRFVERPVLSHRKAILGYANKLQDRVFQRSAATST